MVALTKKRSAAVPKTKAKALDVNLSDVADSFGDDFLIIDRDYKIVLANMATQKRLGQQAEKHCNKEDDCKFVYIYSHSKIPFYIKYDTRND